MKRVVLFAAVALFLLVPFCFALEITPYMIEELDATVTQRAFGTVSGDVSSNDELDIEFVTFSRQEGQEIISQEAQMDFGGKDVEGIFEERNGNRVAVFEVKDLSAYGSEFEISIRTRIDRKAGLEIGDDYNLSLPAADYRELLLPTAFIESSDPELVSKAGIEFTSDSAIESVRQIAEWVNRNITYDFNNYYSETYSAKHTYEKRAGVCDEFANLTAAFLRIKGLPVKYVSGISFDGRNFGNHGWLKVYLNNSWYGVDSTYGEAFFLDAAHLELMEGADANENKALRWTTLSRKPINVEIMLEEQPDVEVNSVKRFSGLTEVSAEIPEKVYPLHEYDLNILIRNVSGERIMIPARLELHRDFIYSGKDNIILLEKDAEETLTRKVKNTAELKPGNYLTYNAFLITPDGEDEFSVSVFYSAEEAEITPAAEVREILPSIDYDSNILGIRIMLSNSGGADSVVSGELKYKEESLGTFSRSIGKGTTEEVRLTVEGIRAGNYSLVIELDGRTKTFTVYVPEKRGDLPVVKEEGKPPDDAAKQEEVTGRLPFPEEMLPYAVLGGVVVLALVTVLLLARKRFGLKE
jgi:hypothetical protein